MDDNIELMHNCDKNNSCNFTSFLSAKENNKMVKIGDFCTQQAGCTVYIYIYIYMCVSVVEKKFESYFRDQLTFSNVDCRTSRRIYRLALLLRAPETLSSLSKSRISIFNAHLTLLVRKMTSHNSIGKYRHLVN